MQYYTDFTKEQTRYENMPGHNKFEPKHLTQDNCGNIFWRKWRDDDKPLVKGRNGLTALVDCNEFRVWIIDKEGQSRIVNIKELYKNAINIVDITTTYQVINRQYFNLNGKSVPSSDAF